MRFRTLVLIAVVVSMIGTTGCALFRRSNDGVSHTPNQVLWQVREQIIQVARDARDAHSLDLISDKRYAKVQAEITRAASRYNLAKRHFEITRRLKTNTLDDVRGIIALVAKMLVEKEG